MVVNLIKHYPNVCRLCLKVSIDILTIPVSTWDLLFHGTIEDFLSLFTFDAPEKSQLFPRQICHPCLETLRGHAKFQNRLKNLSWLMNAIAESITTSSCTSLKELFRTKGDHMQKLFDELQLKYDIDKSAVDIINAFSKHPDVSQTRVGTSKTNEREEHRNVPLAEEIKKSIDQSPSHVKQNEDGSRNKETPSFSSDSSINCDESQPMNNSININEIPVGEEIELVDEKVQNKEESDQPKKRKPGRPRKEIKTLRCRICSSEFHDRKAFDRHRWTAHKPFVCEQCGQRCVSQHSLDNHLARHKNEEEFQCEYCRKLYNVKEDLNHHIKQIHLARENIRCDTCGLEFKHKVTLETHKLTHKDAYGFPCTKCDKKFKTGRQRHAHTYRIHKEPSHTCDECSKVFRTRFELLDHIETIHEVQMRFYCHICVEVFDDKDQLKVHKARHRSPAELECGTCLLVFNSKDQMFNHLCITYKKDYVCCNKDHGHHRTYNKHQLIKHGVKTNVRVKPKANELAGQTRANRKRVESCSQCEIVFPSRQAKQRHVKQCGKDDFTDHSKEEDH